MLSGRKRSKFVRENPDHAPKMINSRPLFLFETNWLGELIRSVKFLQIQLHIRISLVQ